MQFYSAKRVVKNYVGRRVNFPLWGRLNMSWNALQSFRMFIKIWLRYMERGASAMDWMEITLRNQIIPYKESTQFLVITLDSRLNWEEHIDRIRELKTIKVRGRSGNCEKTVQWVCRCKILMIFYFSWTSWLTLKYS